MSRRGKKGGKKKKAGNAAELGSDEHLHSDWNIYDDLTLVVAGPPSRTSGRRTMVKHGKVVAVATTRASLSTKQGEMVSAVLLRLEDVTEEGPAFWLDPDRFGGLEISSPLDPKHKMLDLTAKQLKGTKASRCGRHLLSPSSFRCTEPSDHQLPQGSPCGR